MTDVNLSPETLQEESSKDRARREMNSGVFGNGHIVECHPTAEAEVVEKKHRVVCLLKPYPACGVCSHSKFKMVFNADPSTKLKTVLCPRWNGGEDQRLRGGNPDEYVETEIKTCSERPFPFCPSCPSLEALSQLHVDKQKDGWYSRYKRFTKEEEE